MANIPLDDDILVAIDQAAGEECYSEDCPNYEQPMQSYRPIPRFVVYYCLECGSSCTVDYRAKDTPPAEATE